MNGISPKVSNAVGAGGATSPLAVIIIWALGHWMTIPPEIAGAMSSIIAVIAGGFAGWLTPHDPATQAAINAANLSPAPAP
jgi:hypothetical protein